MATLVIPLKTETKILWKSCWNCKFAEKLFANRGHFRQNLTTAKNMKQIQCIYTLLYISCPNYLILKTSNRSAFNARTPIDNIQHAAAARSLFLTPYRGKSAQRLGCPWSRLYTVSFQFVVSEVLLFGV